MTSILTRVPEPELMEDEAQALAYARADFSEANQLFADLLEADFPAPSRGGRMLDLGCGPADIPLELATRFPELRIDAVDGSAAMLALAREACRRAGLEARVNFLHGRIPHLDLATGGYDLVICNSLLHHLPDPAVLWSTIRGVAKSGAAILVMDLLRPPDAVAVEGLVSQYAAGEPEVLRRDLRNSLHAAFRVDEVSGQIAAAGLDLRVRQVSDRHLAISGRR